MRVIEDWGDYSGRIEYPNKVAYCNMPMLVRVTQAEEYVGAAVSIVVNGETYAETRELRDGACVFDIARYAQMAFVGKSLEYVLIDYQDKAQTAPTAQEVDIAVRMTRLDGVSEDAVSDKICVVYGRLDIGQASGGYRKRRWFVNLPQSFDFLSSADTYIDLEINREEQSISKSETYDLYGQVYVNLSPHTIGEVAAEARKAFLRAGDVPVVEGNLYSSSQNIYELAIDRCTSGVYLRWLDSQGQWCYYLFRVVGQTYNTSVAQEWVDGIVRNELTPERDVYLASGQQHQRMSEVETISLGAKLVDAETFDYLLSLTSASLVDVMVNKEEYVAGLTEDARWERVQVVAGSYARTAATLQDFVVSIKRRAQKGQML